MQELVQSNIVLIVVGLLVLALLIGWLFAARRRTRVEIEDQAQDDAPARRNQALIDAPPAAAPPVPTVATTVAEAVMAAAPDAPNLTVQEESADDLTRIKGLGPKLAEQLHGMGVTSFAQIAAWDDAEIDRVDTQLGRFRGRIRRDNWPEQARLLAAGDMAGYRAKFGNL